MYNMNVYICISARCRQCPTGRSVFLNDTHFPLWSMLASFKAFLSSLTHNSACPDGADLQGLISFASIPRPFGHICNHKNINIYGVPPPISFLEFYLLTNTAGKKLYHKGIYHFLGIFLL